MAPPSDIRDSDRRGESKSPCTDEGRPSELVDRDRDGPIGGRTTRINDYKRNVDAKEAMSKRQRTLIRRGRRGVL
jgi:hypothetical protein